MELRMRQGMAMFTPLITVRLRSALSLPPRGVTPQTPSSKVESGSLQFISGGASPPSARGGAGQAPAGGPTVAGLRWNWIL
ncbi:hypothetical protein FQA47_010929 [Oryzias melastigma]|uniref:Uncharacterized protein n=1 Tax=Oryzias melastigma TaxID=30732 RepID=A0A834C137_ORYME|nr:hypothetical protein FQA47_010929 [Oryzias melastigma]